ncbi:MAG: PhzF family phenazine biosynthesis protein [Clostridia bacterium]|nr:PhzF family phenazine biosynthesis protein [Clostridia bacterium]
MKYYIIDVFTNELFKGNPAGVCLLDKWLDDSLLQSIAFENNLSDTAFLVKQNGFYDLRWFTPTIEVDLCGHATAASAFVLFNFYEKDINELTFKTKSGVVSVAKENDILFLEFPSRPATECNNFKTFEKAFGCKPEAVFKAVDFLVLLKDANTVKSLKPDFAVLKQIKEEAGLDSDSFGVIVTAKGDSDSENYDFVSRFFAPNLGIDEDPVTGRSHCTLIPYWSEKLGKTKMSAGQLSNRGGSLICEYMGSRVKIGGKAVCYLIGDLII